MNTDFSRRRFVQQTAAASVALLTGNGFLQATEAGKKLKKLDLS